MDTLIRVGAPAPEFSLPDLEGRMHRLADLRGRIVLLNFWSAECPWSERGDETLAKLATEWGAEVLLLSVASNLNESPEDIKAAAEARDLPLVLRDADCAVADAYGAVTTPHLFLIDAQGVLRYQGAPNDASWRNAEPSRHYVVEAVEALREGRDPDPAETEPRGCAIVRHVMG